MNEPVDLTEACSTLLRLTNPPGPEDAYYRHFRGLCITHHPALAAVMAHEDFSGHRYGGRPNRMEAA